MIKNAIFAYLFVCILFSFIDIDFDAETEHTAYVSLAKQTLYMNKEQIAVYMNDFQFLDSIGKAGGARSRLLHGKEAHEIHDLANENRVALGLAEISFPSKSISEYQISFFWIPIVIIQS